jgi:hypothetical protein
MPSLNPAATPSATAATPTDTPTTPSNGTTPGDDPGSASKAGSSLDKVNAGVALSSRCTLSFTILAGVVATSLMF